MVISASVSMERNWCCSSNYKDKCKDYQREGCWVQPNWYETGNQKVGWDLREFSRDSWLLLWVTEHLDLDRSRDEKVLPGASARVYWKFQSAVHSLRLAMIEANREKNLTFYNRNRVLCDSRGAWSVEASGMVLNAKMYCNWARHTEDLQTVRLRNYGT